MTSPYAAACAARLVLHGRAYVQEAELGPGDAGTLEHPWPVRIDMAEFVLPG